MAAGPRAQILAVSANAALAPAFSELKETGYPSFRAGLRQPGAAPVGVASSPLGLVPELQFGQSAANLEGAYRQTYVARVDVPYGLESITFKLSGGAGDADLFVARAGGTTVAKQSCFSETPSNAESCTVKTPVEGSYQVLIYAAAPFSGLQFDMSAVRPPLSEVDAARFLTKATFGPTIPEIRNLQKLGVDAWLEEQFNKPIALTHQDWILKGGTVPNNNNRPRNTVNDSLFYKFISSEDQLRQRVANALAQIFVINTATVGNRYAEATYADMLERHAFGNFRDLLKDVTYSAAMGKFLDSDGSSAEKTVNGVTTYPDENYAREVMQLFTIGLHKLNSDGTVVEDSAGEPIPTYGNDDVLGLARVFTGLRPEWTSANEPKSGLPMVMKQALHEQREKSFLGKTVPAGLPGDQSIGRALSILFNHPNVGPFIGRQLIQRLVTSNPTPYYVKRVAATFNDNGLGVRGDMKAVVRAILTDRDALHHRFNNNAEARHGKVREPLLRVTAWARAAGVHSNDKGVVPTASSGAVDLISLKQEPLNAPSVFNFYRPGFSPQDAYFAEKDFVAPELQIADETANLAHIQLISKMALEGRATKATNFDAWSDLKGDPAQLQARAELLLAPARFNDARRKLIVNAVSTIPASSGSNWQQQRAAMALMLTAVSIEHIIQK